MLLEGYYRRLSQAKSLNSVNQINIAYGNTMTPQEVLELDGVLFARGSQPPPPQVDRTFSEEDLRVAAREWIEGGVAHLMLMGKAEAEPFLRRDLRQSITLYTDGSPAAGKTLIVAFPGASNRLMLPIAAVLQALDATKVDLVVVRDPKHSAYFYGLEGFADGREALFDALPSFLDFGAYEQVSALGVSFGGLPALLLALRHNLHSVLACGPDTPFDPRLVNWGGADAAAALTDAAARGYDVRVTIAFGAQHEVDRMASADIARLLGIAAPLEITNAKGNVLHNILHPLAEEGRLPSFLAEHLGL